VTQRLDASFTLVETINEANDFVHWLGEARDSIIAVDTETTGFKWWDDTIRTIQVGDAHHGWVFRTDRWGGLFDEFHRRYNGQIAMHNAKFDLAFLKVAGWDFPMYRIEDTRTMVHLDRSDLRSGLKPASDRLIGAWASRGQKQLDQYKRAHGWDWSTVPVDLQAYWAYGALDTVLTARIFELLKGQTMGRYRAVYDVEIQCLEVLMNMEMHGARVDLEYASKKSDELRAWAKQMREWAREKYGIENLTSGPQTMAWLIDHAGFVPTELTDGGNPSTKKEVMELIDHPLADAHTRTKHAEKMANTYFENFHEWSDDDGLIHCKINPIGARTGRMSVSEPSLQNLPRSALIRGAFVPSDGNKLVLCDYDQMEVRLAGHFTQDAGLIKLINESDDIHTDAAAMLYDCDPSEVTKYQRQLTKNTTYGTIYGGGAAALANAAKIPMEEAATFSRMYKAMFPGIPRLQKRLADEARATNKNGIVYLTSPSGRRHYCEEDKAYKLINYLIQGEGAEVLKRKLVALDAAGLGEYMVVPVHDEVMFDVPADLAEDVMHEACRVMRSDDYSVPLTVDGVVVDRWGDKYKKTAA
jgi:DNA polymerase I